MGSRGEFQACLRDAGFDRSLPGIETPGYYQSSLRDELRYPVGPGSIHLAYDIRWIESGRMRLVMADDEQKQIGMLARYSEIGFIIPAAVLLGFFLGKLLDYWLHSHWIYIAGLIFGAVVGFVEMIRMATSSLKDGQ